MPRFGHIIIIYFVIGAVMFGGGAVAFDNAGIAQFFVSQENGHVQADPGPQDNTSGLGGAISSLVGQFGGGIVLVWNLIVGILAFMNWPVTVLVSNHAPPSVIILLGGTLEAMFYVSLVRVVRTSA